MSLFAQTENRGFRRFSQPVKSLATAGWTYFQHAVAHAPRGGRKCRILRLHVAGSDDELRLGIARILEVMKIAGGTKTFPRANRKGVVETAVAENSDEGFALTQ
jgi:hypothetical protein